MPKTRLEVLIDDPGEWCKYVDTGNRFEVCPLYDSPLERCNGGHGAQETKVISMFAYGAKRPQSCKDAVRK